LASPGRFSVRIIKSSKVKMVNICDIDILGTTIKDDERKMHISNDFFAGQVVGFEEATKILQKMSIINLVGKKIVDHAVNIKLASPKAIKKIGKVPFLIIYKFEH
tara:strand:+ start:1405 stop:1719 length:315 start_codon:yes stop_codon:yes gene_type:complete